MLASLRLRRTPPCLEHWDGDLIGHRTHGLRDPRASVGVVGRKEHLLDEPSASRGAARTSERREHLCRDPLPCVCCQRRRVDQHERADGIGSAPGQRERNHRSETVPDNDRATDVAACGEASDLACERVDRVLVRRRARAVPREVDGDHAMSVREVLELRTEETVITAPAVQAQHRRIPGARRVVCKLRHRNLPPLRSRQREERTVRQPRRRRMSALATPE
jgi:hypothetical protein